MKCRVFRNKDSRPWPEIKPGSSGVEINNATVPDLPLYRCVNVQIGIDEFLTLTISGNMLFCTAVTVGGPCYPSTV